MSDEHEEVDIEFDVTDKVTPKLTRMEKAVEKLDQRVGRASEKFMHFGEMAAAAAGVFGAAESIRAARDYIEHIDQLSDLTGLAADKAAGISEALQITGTSAGEVEAIFGRITKRGALAEEQNKQMAAMAARYGVNLADGPEKVLVRMSKLYTDQKIGAGQIGRILGVQGKTLSSIMDAMDKGPAALSKMIAEATDKNSFLGGNVMDQMQSYKESVNRVGLAWKRLVAGVIVKLAPTLEKAASMFEDKIEGWMEKAQKFGTFLVDHMHTIVNMAKTYAKIMFANRVLEKVTGKGLVGSGLRAGKWLASDASPIGGILKSMSSLSKLGIIGVIIGGVISMFSVLRENFNGIGTRLKEVFGGIGSTLVRIGSKIMGIFSDDSPLGRFFKGVGYAFLKVIEKIGEAMQLVLSLVEKIIDALPAVFSQDVVDVPARMREAKAWEEGIAANLKKAGVAGAAYADKMSKAHEFAQRYIKTGSWVAQTVQMKATAKAAGAKPPEAQVYQDFRGSRFDIKQEFAEGFDPDRIAVAFANDVASIGERKLQSGFSPLFSVR